MSDNKKASMSLEASAVSPANDSQSQDYSTTLQEGVQGVLSEGWSFSRAVGKVGTQSHAGALVEPSSSTPDTGHVGFPFQANLAQSCKTSIPTTTLPSPGDLQAAAPQPGGMPGSSGRPPAGAAPLGYMGISGQSESEESTKKVASGCHARVCIHAHGTVTKDIGKVINKPPKGGGKRGQIREWSKKSRTRLRQALAMLGAPEGWKTFGLTMTIPGPVVTASQYRYLWRLFLRQIRKHKVCCSLIWRIELQTRLQPHVHAVVFYPPDKGNPFEQLIFAWCGAVDNTPIPPGQWPEDQPGGHPVEWDRMKGYTLYGDEVRNQPVVKTRMTLRGALEHCCDVTEEIGEDDFGWWRYLASHAGKAKQDQLGWIGRAWGIVNPQNLSKTPHAEHDLTLKQWWRFRRIIRRILGYKGAGGGRRSVYYARPGTMAQIIEWVKNNIDVQAACAIVPT